MNYETEPYEDLDYTPSCERCGRDWNGDDVLCADCRAAVRPKYPPSARYICTHPNFPAIVIDACSERDAQKEYAWLQNVHACTVSVKYYGRLLVDNFSRFTH